MTELFKKITKADIRNIISVLIVSLSYLFLFMLLFKSIPTENKDILNISIGFIIGGAFSGVVGYYFGASKKQEKEPEED